MRLGLSSLLVGIALILFAPDGTSQDVARAVDASWLPAEKGAPIPSDAAVGGDDPAREGEPAKTFYVCRAPVGSAIAVGKAQSGGACELSHWGIPRLVDRFEVLQALASDWFPLRSDAPGGVPIGGLVTGGRETDGEVLYVCRAVSICRMRNTDGTTGVCTIEGRHPGSLDVAPDGSARCLIAHAAFGACTCHEYEVLVSR